ncbi:MAG TPA: ATP-binding protein [Solirubrobacteraceae bacterium]|nr:ATP-binding protein [Solirubrobacteraceae bacterium]
MGCERSGRAGPSEKWPLGRRSGSLLETTICRLVQELLTNIVKHARASQVRLSVAAIDGEGKIEAQDDGVGFDPHGARRRVRSGRDARARIPCRRHSPAGVDETGTVVGARLPQ